MTHCQGVKVQTKNVVTLNYWNVMDLITSKDSQRVIKTNWCLSVCLPVENSKGSRGLGGRKGAGKHILCNCLSCGAAVEAGPLVHWSTGPDGGLHSASTRLLFV